MPILTWPKIDQHESVCIYCGQALSFTEATIASSYLDNRPALACEAHRQNKIDWLEACINFEQSRPTIDLSKVPTAFNNVDLYIESRQQSSLTYWKSDLSLHLLTRAIVGPSLIVTNHPIEFLSTLRKYWKKMTKQLHIERARSLYQPKIGTLDTVLERLHSLTFSGSLKQPKADVLVLSPNDLVSLEPRLTTAYICHPLTEVQRIGTAKVLRRGGVIVDYFQPITNYAAVRNLS